jgi:hypothetical protein
MPFATEKLGFWCQSEIRVVWNTLYAMSSVMSISAAV